MTILIMSCEDGYLIKTDGTKECFVTYKGNVEIGEGIDSVVLKTIPIIPKEIVTVPVVANTSYTFKNYFYVIINLSGEVILRKLTTTLNAETVTIQLSCTFLV